MRYTEQAKKETEFFSTHVARGRKFEVSPFNIPIPGDDNLKLDGFVTRPADGYSGYFEPEATEKDRITLHFTVGHLQSDLHVLTKPKPGEARWRLSVPFLIARNGNILQLHSSAHWSHHLGENAIGGNQTMSKSSIGIELSNYGPLIKKGNDLETYYSRRRDVNVTDVYCSIDDTDQYIKLDKPYRGYTYFAAFTDAQYENLILLLRYLTATYKIPRTFINEPERYRASATTAHHMGINSHVNFRSGGKVDFGPAFDWNRVIKGVQAAFYGDVSGTDVQILEARSAVRNAEVKLESALQTEEASVKSLNEANMELNNLLAKAADIKFRIRTLENEMNQATHKVDAAQSQLEDVRDELRETMQRLKPSEMEYRRGGQDIHSSERDAFHSAFGSGEEILDLDYNPRD